MAHWTDEFFGEEFLQVGLLEMKRERTSAEVDFVLKHMDIPKGGKVLDLCCGIGRHSREFARRGYKVVGLDYTPKYILRAVKEAEKEGLSIEFVRGDMRKLPYDNEFDAVVNMWSSFGYYDERTNMRTLRNMFKALKEGGWLALQTINRDWLLVNFQPKDWQRINDGIVFEERKFHYETSRITASWTFILDERTTTKHTDMRVYSPHELLSMFRQVGFVDVVCLDMETDQPVTEKTRLQMVFGRKPRAKRE